MLCDFQGWVRKCRTAPAGLSWDACCMTPRVAVSGGCCPAAAPWREHSLGRIGRRVRLSRPQRHGSSQSGRQTCEGGRTPPPGPRPQLPSDGHCTSEAEHGAPRVLSKTNDCCLSVNTSPERPLPTGSSRAACLGGWLGSEPGGPPRLPDVPL